MSKPLSFRHYKIKDIFNNIATGAVNKRATGFCRGFDRRFRNYSQGRQPQADACGATNPFFRKAFQIIGEVFGAHPGSPA
ncbi:MAG TPA: hypothetical protein VIS78_13450 [Blastocatellia bacterium]